LKALFTSSLAAIFLALSIFQMSVCAQTRSVMIKQVYWSDQSNELLQSIFQKQKSLLLGRNIDEVQLTHITERLTQDLRLQGYLISQVVVSSQDQTLELGWQGLIRGQKGHSYQLAHRDVEG